MTSDQIFELAKTVLALVGALSITIHVTALIVKTVKKNKNSLRQNVRQKSTGANSPNTNIGIGGKSDQ